MKTYYVYFIDGYKKTLIGHDIDDAFTNDGVIKSDVIHRVDIISKSDDYEWDVDKQNWKRKTK